MYKKYIEKAGLHATRFVTKIVVKVNPAWFLILASLLDSRTVKLFFSKIS